MTSKVWLALIPVVWTLACMTAPVKPVWDATDGASEQIEDGSDEAGEDQSGRDDLGADDATDAADIAADVQLDDGNPDVRQDAPDTDCNAWCGEAECGDDGCGGSCGECAGGKVCEVDTCVCRPRSYKGCCGQAVCWFDSCGVQGEKDVDCEKGCSGARCIDCVSKCQDKECDSDGCGGECGHCASGNCEGLVWTAGPACVGGKCLGGGSTQSCDDGNGCTTDACDGEQGCSHRRLQDGTTCVEGRCEGGFWTRPRKCQAGQCSGGGGTESCDDHNPCTEDACYTEAGCISTPNAKPCDDADPCTTVDTCAGGKCVGAGALDCADLEPCTVDSCVKGSGCKHDPEADGKGCGTGACDGLTWTPAASCVSGRCTGAAGGPQTCDDGKACTADACDPAAGCSHDVVEGTCHIGGTCRADGEELRECLVCDADADPLQWTVMDACDDALACTTDSCDAATGDCRHAVQSGWCAIDDACLSPGTPSASNPCAACDPARPTMWSFVEDGKPCGTGGLCHGGECCVPNCAGKGCGADDGCGGKCQAGTCGVNLECDAGRCLPPMVEVPAGSFWMGANKDGTQCPTNALDTQAQSNELPCHPVTVPAFLVEKYEVTVAAYKACVDIGACDAPDACSASSPWGAAGKEQHPLVCVTWTQAQQYCSWSGRRLCSEAEWEKAARGTDGHLYPWGNQTPTCDHAVMGGCGFSSATTVGAKDGDIGPFGAKDLGGNVREWVQDWNHEGYSGAPTDGSAWESPSSWGRISKGTCFVGVGSLARASSRLAYIPTAATSDVGVRCCKLP